MRKLWFGRLRALALYTTDNKILSTAKTSKKAVILLSGGIDSATTLYLARQKGYKLFGLIFDYGQRHKKEIGFAKKLAKLNKIKYWVEKIDIGWAKSSLTNFKIKVASKRALGSCKIPLTYVAGRNIIFLSYAASLADSILAKKIFIGAHIQDYSGYPDCRPEFLKSFEKAINSGLKFKGVKIEAPLLNKNKQEIVKLGRKLGVPFGLTWSCYNGGRNPCLRCDSCRFRMQAFHNLGLVDPLLKK